MNISMKEAAKAWGEGESIQYRNAEGWVDCCKDGFYFSKQVAYRIKPEVTTSLSNDALKEIYYSSSPYPIVPESWSKAPWFADALRSVADTAVKQYIKEQAK